MRKIHGAAAGIAAVAALAGLSASAGASAVVVSYTDVALTQAELDANWVTDRTTPSGGYESLADYEDRSDVLEVRIDAGNQSTLGGFYWTEGIQRATEESSALRVDLFVDDDWVDNGADVRAGLWGVAHDAVHDITAYPIIEFATGADVPGYTGWRVWDGVLGGWTNLPGVEWEDDEWVTLEIVLDEADDQFDFYVDGDLVASNSGGGSTHLGAVILNSKNYATQSYDVHWSNLGLGGDQVLVPTDKDECKKGGWQSFGFANQGQCVAFVESAEHSHHHDGDQSDD